MCIHVYIYIHVKKSLVISVDLLYLCVWLFAHLNIACTYRSIRFLPEQLQLMPSIRSYGACIVRLGSLAEIRNCGSYKV